MSRVALSKLAGMTGVIKKYIIRVSSGLFVAIGHCLLNG